jgi:hypothetical protein
VSEQVLDKTKESFIILNAFVIFEVNHSVRIFSGFPFWWHDLIFQNKLSRCCGLCSPHISTKQKCEHGILKKCCGLCSPHISANQKCEHGILKRCCGLCSPHISANQKCEHGVAYSRHSVGANIWHPGYAKSRFDQNVNAPSFKLRVREENRLRLLERVRA